MVDNATTGTFSPNEAACITGVPLKQIHRIIDAGLLIRAPHGDRRERSVRREELLCLKLVYETIDLLTLDGRRRLVRYLLEHPDAVTARERDVSVNLRVMKDVVKKGLSMLTHARKEVVCDNAVLSGAPCVKGTRIPVHDIADMLSNGDSAAMIGAVYPRISEVQIELAAFYARAYPRRGRPPKSLFWRTRCPTESSETSLDDLLV
ncbi:MAG: DUF433 domain-containing protein [Pseudomonadales bacterium]|nr:DUF433 domain-containing protein [Pseudomonadales bacterium]